MCGCSPNSCWRALRSTAALTLAAVGWAASLAAQEEPPGGVAPPAGVGDTVRPALVATFPAAVLPGPLPLGSRVVFDADSLEWSGAETLADLLTRVPGVYVARAGTYGQAEVVLYGGRGARALEIYWDGMPVDPMGRDSVYAEATRVPLAFLERVEVLVQPAGIRVDLVSRRHRTLTTRSSVRVLTGRFDAAGYRGLFQHRYPSGVGVSLGADWNASDGATPAGEFRGVDLWLKGEWIPSPRAGAAMQVWQASTDRRGGTLDTGPTIVRRDVKRRYQQLAFFVDRRTDGVGLRLEGFVGSTTVSGDSGVPDQTLHHGSIAAAYRSPTWSGMLRLRTRGARTPFGVEASLGWTPWTPLTLGVQAVTERHEAGRTSTSVSGGASLALPAGFRLRGTYVTADGPEAPAIPTDSGSAARDAAGFFGWQSRRAAVEVGLVRRDAFRPAPPPELGAIAALAPSPASSYLSLRGSIGPVAGVTLSGWFEEPVRGGADFAPPQHWFGTATFRSKLWRWFPSGAFDVKLEVQLESWGAGRAGVGAGGEPVALPAATFVHALVEFEIVDVRAFWHLRNAGVATESYVPGYPYGEGVQWFGVRWAFAN